MYQTSRSDHGSAGYIDGPTFPRLELESEPTESKGVLSLNSAQPRLAVFRKVATT